MVARGHLSASSEHRERRDDPDLRGIVLGDGDRHRERHEKQNGEQAAARRLDRRAQREQARPQH